MMTSQKICFIIITLGSRQEQEIMWAGDVLKKWHFFLEKSRWLRIQQKNQAFFKVYTFG